MSMPLRDHAPAFIRCGVALLIVMSCVANRGVCVWADTSQADLDAITARGRALYEYDVNAERASSAVDPLLEPAAKAGLLEWYVGSRGSDGTWTFDFGKLNPDGTFAVALEAKQKASGSKEYSTQALSPTRTESGYAVAAARAVKTALGAFSPVAGRRYEYATLDAGSGQFYVYLYPAQTNTKSYAFGGDERFLISADGTTIVERHRMHRAVIDIPNAGAPVPAGSTLHAFYHTDITGTLPEDTDVLWSLRRNPPLEQDVIVGGHIFLISSDDSIVDKGPAPAPSPR